MKRTPLQVLLRKRADALRSIDVRLKSISELEARVSALDAQISALGGRINPERSLRIPHRANGEMQRAAFDLLRERGSITAANLAEHMLARLNLPEINAPIGYAMRQRCIQCLKRMERFGRVRNVGQVGRFSAFVLVHQSATERAPP